MERFRSEGDPLGWSVEVSGVAVQVVGVAADARYIVQDVDPDPILYLSRSDDDAGPVVLTIRAGAPGDLSSDVADVIRSVIPGMPRPPRMRVAREVIDDALLPQKVGSVLIGVMGLAALLLAAVGLYGLIHFTVTRDAHELGVRLALGGGRRDLATIVLRKGFTLAAIGTAAGVVVSLLAAPALGGFLGEVSPADPVTYAMVVACFTVVALIASWIPARRALRIDATEALRGGG
jgi:ABC-type antimicrobial peptide transport system permease subunit